MSPNVESKIVKLAMHVSGVFKGFRGEQRRKVRFLVWEARGTTLG